MVWEYVIGWYRVLVTIFGIIIVLALVLTQCNIPSANLESESDGSYFIRVEAGESFTVAGSTAIWSPDGLTISLGPDEGNAPAAQIILVLERYPETGALIVADAALSTTDRFTGDADEIDGMTFHASYPSACDASERAFTYDAQELSRERIEGEFCFDLDLVAPEDGPPRARAYGTFVAEEP